MTKINLHSYEYLVENNIGLVYMVVDRFRTDAFERDDLIQAGLMGLLQASHRYDVLKGLKFSTFACPFILGAVKKELRKRNYIKVSRLHERIAKVIKENPDMDFESIAITYKWKMEDIVIASNYISGNLLIENIDEIAEWEESRSVIITNKIEELIYQMRFVLRYTQSMIAERTGVSQSTISRIIKKMKQRIDSDNKID